VISTGRRRPSNHPLLCIPSYKILHSVDLKSVRYVFTSTPSPLSHLKLIESNLISSCWAHIVSLVPNWAGINHKSVLWLWTWSRNRQIKKTVGLSYLGNRVPFNLTPQFEPPTANQPCLIVYWPLHNSRICIKSEKRSGRVPTPHL